jgi:hypothetical protein
MIENMNLVKTELAVALGRVNSFGVCLPGPVSFEEGLRSEDP